MPVQLAQAKIFLIVSTLSLLLTLGSSAEPLNFYAELRFMHELYPEFPMVLQQDTYFKPVGLAIDWLHGRHYNGITFTSRPTPRIRSIYLPKDPAKISFMEQIRLKQYYALNNEDISRLCCMNQGMRFYHEKSPFGIPS